LQFPESYTSISNATRDGAFPPEFTHQIFEDEEISGYKDLHMDIFFALDAYVPLLLHGYEDKQFPARDYVRALATHFTEGLHCDLAAARAQQVCPEVPAP
jgi:Histone acetyl transferase HAT1 N-terminus